MSQDPAISSAANQLEVVIGEEQFANAIDRMAAKINELIETDFNRLVSILYRLDINEIKLKQLLKQYEGTDAGSIIAAMMIEREREKIRSRQQFKQRNEDISDEEKW